MYLFVPFFVMSFMSSLSHCLKVKVVIPEKEKITVDDISKYLDKVENDTLPQVELKSHDVSKQYSLNLLHVSLSICPSLSLLSLSLSHSTFSFTLLLPLLFLLSLILRRLSSWLRSHRYSVFVTLVGDQSS